MSREFTHNCDQCKYLGYTCLDGKRLEWYHCPSPFDQGWGSIIARFGSEPGSYWSSPVAVVRSVQGKACTVTMRLAFAICGARFKEFDHA